MALNDSDGQRFYGLCNNDRSIMIGDSKSGGPDQRQSSLEDDQR
jgi:hypothetical protein